MGLVAEWLSFADVSFLSTTQKGRTGHHIPSFGQGLLRECRRRPSDDGHQSHWKKTTHVLFYLEASRAVMSATLRGPLCMMTDYQSGGLFHLHGKRSSPHMHIATKPHMIYSIPGGQEKSIDNIDDLSAEAADVWVGGWMD